MIIPLYSEKFIYYYPDGYSTPALEEELQNGQVCPECAPDCGRVLYSAAVSVAHYSQPVKHKYFKRDRYVTNRFISIN